MAKKQPGKKGNCELWIALLLGPTAWLIQLEMNYALVPWACASGQKYIFSLISLLCLMLTTAAGFISFMSLGVKNSSKASTIVAAHPTFFLARLGVLINSVFFLAIIAQAIPSLLLNPCEGSI
jgi:hypothetical protein